MASAGCACGGTRLGEQGFAVTSAGSGTMDCSSCSSGSSGSSSPPASELGTGLAGSNRLAGKHSLGTSVPRAIVPSRASALPFGPGGAVEPQPPSRSWGPGPWH